jgi:hypothetical protein
LSVRTPKCCTIHHTTKMPAHALTGFGRVSLRPSQRHTHAVQRCRAGATEGVSTSGRSEYQPTKVRSRGLNAVQQVAVAAAGVAGAVIGASAVSALFAEPAGAAQNIGGCKPHSSALCYFTVILLLSRVHHPGTQAVRRLGLLTQQSIVKLLHLSLPLVVCLSDSTVPTKLCIAGPDLNLRKSRADAIA